MKIAKFASLVALSFIAVACSKSASISVSTGGEEEPAPAPAEEAPAEEAPAEEAPAEEAPAEEAPVAAEDPSDVHIEGDHITIDQKIHFARNSDEILDDSSEILDHIAQALKNHTEFATLEVIGHTDANGSHEHNVDLSERRAASVVKALEERGVTQKISSKGVGEDEPTCEEDTDECHEKNRRVEFVVH